uniref:NADH-ubiquinone oxidoreductase chain 2 n=1 Tax=Gyraulus sp. GE1 TaxID=2880038 RepID=A0A976LYY3_9GAST|nr:NADH dehydrogenase subunit 2 [Gyraulus sp. GE1]
MYSSNLLFFFLIIMSPIISLSSSDWIISWLGMEIGMFSIIPLLLFKSTSNEPAMKYFLIQSLASALILISGIFLITIKYDLFFMLLFVLGMSMKLGFFPGHFWVISIVENLSWTSCMMMLGPLKIAPFGFLSMFSDNMFLIGFAMASVFVGSLLGMNQLNVRAMLGASSISHSGWMIFSMCYGYLWMYMFVYMLLLMFLFMSLSIMDNLSTSVCLISMSGLPPFVMFLVKMKVIYYIIFNLEYLYLMFLVVSSIISLFFYLKFFYFFSFKWKINQTFTYYTFVILNIIGVFMMLYL